MSSGCQPNYSDANPCQGEPPGLIREQGRPGAPGIPGGTPVFQVGTVLSGGTPSVTYTMINPLLYRVDYIIPGTATSQANTWTATQTFAGGVVVTGAFETTGGATLDSLHVTGTSTFDGASEFGGSAEFASSLTCLTTITTANLTASGTSTLNGPLINAGIAALPAAKAILGQVVADSCGQFYYINGQGPNSVVGATALAQSVPFDQAETAIAFTVAFTVPSVADCGSPANANVTIFGRVVTDAGGALPADISNFIVRIRLDNPTTGTVLAAPKFTNFELEGQWYVNANLAPGTHTLYFTVQGLAVGSASIGLTEIDCSVNF